MSNANTPKPDLTHADLQDLIAGMRRGDPVAERRFDALTARVLEDPEIQQALLEHARAAQASEDADPVAHWAERLAYRRDTLARLLQSDPPPAILRHQHALIRGAEARLGYHLLRRAYAAYEADPGPATERALGDVIEGPYFAAAMAHLTEVEGGRLN